MTRMTINGWRSTTAAWLLMLGITGGTMMGVRAATSVADPTSSESVTISEKEEIETGKKIAAEAAYMYGDVLPATDPLSVRVARIGMSLAKLSGRHHIPYCYKVLNNTHIANAFSIGGGPIFITKKLVGMTSNDAELAYVLGHETGHIDRKHMVADMEKRRQAARLVRNLGRVFGTGGDIIGSIGYIAFSFWSLGYSRNQETEADIVGVRLMSQLGYDPHAAVKMLDKFDKLYPHSSGGYLSTHPAAQVREARIQELISDEKLMDVALTHGGPRLWPAGLANRVSTLQYLTQKASQQVSALGHGIKSAASAQVEVKAGH